MLWLMYYRVRIFNIIIFYKYVVEVFILNCFVECVFLCIGADIDVCDKFGNTFFYIVVRYGYELLINILLENGSDFMK